jgi:hypothetical protein
LLEIVVIEVSQNIQVDVVRLKRVGVLLKIVPTQPVAKLTHTIGSPTPAVQSQIGTSKGPWGTGTLGVGFRPHQFRTRNDLTEPQQTPSNSNKDKASAVLGGLKAELRAPKVISEYVRTYLDERKRLAATSHAKRQHLEQQLGQLNRDIERLVDAIAKGHGDPSVLGPRSTALDAERKRIAEELQSEPPAQEVAQHPAILKRYEEQLGRLEEALGKGVSAGDGEAAEAIRDLVETVTVFRDRERPGGVAVEIASRLNALLGQGAYPNRVKGVWGKVVAGVRYIAKPTISEALFSYRRAA